jgi:hypothetical protein
MVTDLRLAMKGVNLVPVGGFLYPRQRQHLATGSTWYKGCRGTGTIGAMAGMPFVLGWFERGETNDQLINLSRRFDLGPA